MTGSGECALAEKLTLVGVSKLRARAAAEPEGEKGEPEGSEARVLDAEAFAKRNEDDGFGDCSSFCRAERTGVSHEGTNAAPCALADKLTLVDVSKMRARAAAEPEGEKGEESMALCRIAKRCVSIRRRTSCSSLSLLEHCASARVTVALGTEFEVLHELAS